MIKKKLAIDMLRSAIVVDDDIMQKVLALHDACSNCKGAGGAIYLYPECPCHECGFTVFDSCGVEDIPRRKE